MPTNTSSRSVLFPSILLLLLLAGFVEAQQENIHTRVDRVFATFSGFGSPGCALGVIQSGEFVLKRGYGMANLEYGIPLSDSSVFRIGSTSKQFTAAAIVLLEQEGKLSLDDDIRLYLPEIQEYSNTVTIRHLLNHTSGIRDYLGLMYLAGMRDDDWANDNDVLQMIARQRELNFQPGEEWLYSNSGYFLLSQIVLRVSGQSLGEYMAEKLFQPLGMTDTHFHDDHTQIVPKRASGYARTRGGDFRISMTTLGMVGDGGVFTTVNDLLLWDDFFYDPAGGFTPESHTEFWESMLTRGILNSGDTLDYALGLRHSVFRGLNMVSHGGAFVGFRAEMMRFPEQRFSIICLCNLGSANPTSLASRVADIYLEDLLEPRTPPTPRRSGDREDEQASTFTLSMAESQEYAGDYYSEELDVTYSLLIDGDSLLLSVGNNLDGHLRPVARDEMRKGVSFHFLRDALGTITGFVLDAGRVKNLRFSKIE